MMIDLDDGFVHMLGTKVDAKTGKYDADVVKDGDKTAQAEILITTGETQKDAEGNVEDVAYLKIRSAKQYDPEHYLLYVGSEEFYLQTDNYKPWEYQYQEG
jgi:hypothetical protein